MNKKDRLEKIRLYEIDLKFCKESGYHEVATDIEQKINSLKSQPQEK